MNPACYRRQVGGSTPAAYVDNAAATGRRPGRDSAAGMERPRRASGPAPFRLSATPFAVALPALRDPSAGPRKPSNPALPL
ncbi:hypothetical protein [Arthrobacter sp. AL12]|uniref:hypothetical protein n=1 Tax=Arthrobacter sp. AL12 TaxID=3042241 RepID=UPI00249BE4AD|nr:hypothetical protein [Arthrobacter sp. AL12]MDI3212025.1 hypothetical protein [Arthrobacter sp. AL12]